MGVSPAASIPPDSAAGHRDLSPLSPEYYAGDGPAADDQLSVILDLHDSANAAAAHIDRALADKIPGNKCAAADIQRAAWVGISPSADPAAREVDCAVHLGNNVATNKCGAAHGQLAAKRAYRVLRNGTSIHGDNLGTGSQEIPANGSTMHRHNAVALCLKVPNNRPVGHHDRTVVKSAQTGTNRAAAYYRIAGITNDKSFRQDRAAGHLDRRTILDQGRPHRAAAKLDGAELNALQLSDHACGAAQRKHGISPDHRIS